MSRNETVRCCMVIGTSGVHEEDATHSEHTGQIWETVATILLTLCSSSFSLAPG